MPEHPFSAEPITIVRIAQPRCGLTFGQAPCTATGTPCYNTYSTCPVQQDYVEGAPLYLYFGIPGQGKPADDLYILPLLAAPPSTSPAQINVSGADRRMNPLGIRAAASITFLDMPHTDRLVDPYLDQRATDPLTVGTFWGRWFARNTFARTGMEVSIFQGFADQALADMVHLLYFGDSIDFSSRNTVTLHVLDVLSKTSDEKALIPPVSPGEVFEALDDNPASLALKVHRATAADYPASGTLRINDEVMTYSGVSEADGVLTFTLTARATDSTEIAAHEAEDRVQECFRLTDAPVDQGLAAVYGYTTIDPALLPVADWTAEAEVFLTAYSLTGLLTSPEPVEEVLGEILEQVQAFQWWDEVAHEVRFKAVRPLTTTPRRLTEKTHLLAGSVSVRDFPDRRVSRVYFYFAPRTPVAARTDEDNYRRIQGNLDLPKEDAKAFGEPAIRRIFARFTRSSAVASETTSRILARYNLGARELSFAVSDKDADIEIGEVIEVAPRQVQATDGTPEWRLWIVKSRHYDHPARQVRYVAEDATLTGRLFFIAPDTVGDWVGDGSDPEGNAWISGANGLLPDGSPGFLIQ